MTELSHRAARVTVLDAQLRQWHGSQVGSTLRLAGPCPVCRHACTATVSLRATDLEGLDPDPATSVTAGFACTCGQEHAGQPASPPKGCGRTWTGHAEVAEDGTVTLRPANDPYLAEAAEAYRIAQAGRVDRLKAGAEKWIAGTTALLGVLGIVGVSLGADQVAALDVAGKAWTAVAVVVAVGAAAVAIQQAYRAAYGQPETRTIADDADLLAWYTAQQGLPEAIGRRLRGAARASAASLGALVVAIGLTWFMPAAEPASPLVKVTSQDQSIVCGTLLKSGTPGAVRVRRADGTVADVQVSSLAPTEKC
ncbi:hypothetical protein GCM10009827_069740 [Dactylosporangium maewongense]|uniref:Uncharacterized protein n=1 Tax=Dactylosporangium maewongense TaxID=634393 RepID=A0ABN2BJI3_9ACTN